MEKLKLKPNVKPSEAKKHPSPGLVYYCPTCKVGHSLKHISQTTGKVECSMCGKTYQKP